MSLKHALIETIELYEAVLLELRDYKSNEYKQGVADGLEMLIEALKVCLEENNE